MEVNLPRKTIYVREGDEALWDQAGKVAKKEGESLAAVVAAALRQYVQRPQAPGVPDTASAGLGRDVNRRSAAAFDQMVRDIGDLKRRVHLIERKKG